MGKQKLNIKNVAVGSTVIIGLMGIYSNADLIQKEISLLTKTVEEEKVLEIILNEGDNISDLSGNPDGYTKIVVTTAEDKKLDSVDFSRLKSAKIPKIDLNGAKADSIPSDAFKSSTWLTEFMYPSGITSIGSNAFYNCTGLTGDLIIPDSVTSIGSYAFRDCSGFDGNLIIGNGLSTINSAVFSGCTGFRGDLIIPDNITSIYKAISAPSSLNPFYNFGSRGEGINELIIGRGLESELKIQYIFYGSKIKQLKIAEGVESIGANAFEGFDFNIPVKLPSTLKTIENDAFYNSKISGNLVIPDSVTSIGISAFKNCTGLTGDLIIPDSVTSIGSYAFRDCSGFDGNLIIGSGLSTINSAVFSGCTGFTGDLIIPDNITSVYIGPSAPNLLNPFYNFGSRGEGINELIIGRGLESELKIQYIFYGSKIKQLKIAEGVESIGANAFEGFDFNIPVKLPSTLKTIENDAFYNSKISGNLVIPDSVTSIGISAFEGCSGLTGDLIIPDSVTSIGGYAFRDCSGFDGDLIIPDSVTSIGSYAFRDCSGFDGNLIIGSGLSTINSAVFSGCTGFTGDLIIGKGVKTIGSNAFYNVTNIQRIIIASGDEFIDTDYRKSIINNLDKSKTLIDLPYNFDESDTWIETESTARKVKPTLKKVIKGEELDYDNKPSKEIILLIETPYRETDITVLKDEKEYNLPQAINGKYIFTEEGVYNIAIETIAGAVSNIEFTVDSSIVDFDYTEIENAVEKAETTLDIKDIEDARDLVNQAPEGTKKEEFQDRLDVIFPNLTLESKNATANLDVYVKSENMLSMSLSTNSVTFEDFSGVEDLEITNAINISISSSLPYQLNSYMITEIQNSNKLKTIDKSLFNIRDNSEIEYKKFNNIDEKLVLKDFCEKGNNKIHSIDLKLNGGDAHKSDTYKTVIKFEAEQK